MNDRIQLAEAMGWENILRKPYPNDNGKLYGTIDDVSGRRELPNPFTDANDCEALIQHLNSLGWQVEIHWQHTCDENLAAGSWIHIWQHGTEIHHRADIDVDRWKIMVCNIALAILAPVAAHSEQPEPK